MPATPEPTELARFDPETGSLAFNPHHGQWQAWESQKRFVCVLAGTQSGKTTFGPHWLYREIERRGPGDYLVVTPTFQLLAKKALPEFRKLFERWLGLGQYRLSPTRQFVFTEDGDLRTHGRHDPEQPTTVYFGYAEDPESLESMTVKAAWLDEAGQKKFRVGSWEAIQRRLAVHTGRALLTTTPYDLGWLKQQIFDPWKAAGGDHPELDVIRFDSTENPAFPQEEFDRARATLPRWKFDLFYRGIFTRPAGLIYDSFLDEPVEKGGHLCKRFPIPADWPRFVGLDFGGVNTAGMFYAMDREHNRLYAYRLYHAGSRSSAEHVREIRKGEPERLFAVGGAKSEGQWRLEFGKAGLKVREPDQSDVEVGIDRVYAAHKLGLIHVFDDLKQYLDQKGSYSRELDERGEPTEKIEDKATYHLMDAERYIVGYLMRGMKPTAFIGGGTRPQLANHVA